MSQKSIEVRVLKTEMVNWRSFEFIQQDDFKDLPEDERSKLKQSLVANNFVQPFYVWEDPQTMFQYCLDGKHRTMLLEELSKEGYIIPRLLPGIFIHCKDKSEAAALVLVYSAAYAKITQQGFFDHVKAFNLSFPDLQQTLSLPNLDLATMQDWFLPAINENETIGLAKNKDLTLKITFKSKVHVDAAEPLIKQIIQQHCPGAYYSMGGGEL